jgi:hypothetical protein
LPDLDVTQPWLSHDWWEIDMTYWVLRVWQAMELIWDLRQPPVHVRAGPLVVKIKPVALGHLT